MKKFFEAEIEVVKFNVNDVITTSTGADEELTNGPDDLGWG